MLDYMIATALILLIGGHGLLIRGCFKINEGLSHESGFITTEIRAVTTVLDEVADLLNEMVSGSTAVSPAKTQTPMDIPTLLTTFLMNKTGMGSDYAETEQEEWEVHPPNATENTLESVESN